MSIKFTYFGHASLGLELDGMKVLVDPAFNDMPHGGNLAETLEADYICVTHGHGDHIGDAVAIAQRTGATVISNFEICNWLAKQGVKTSGQQLGGGRSYPFGYLKLTLALHGSALPDGSYGGNPAGLLLTANNGKKIYMAGDTGLFGDMSLIGEEGLDLAVLPIGDNYTMGPADALRAVKLLQAKLVVPIHYNTWGLIAQDPHAWKERVEAETSTRCQILQPGESLEL